MAKLHLSRFTALLFGAHLTTGCSWPVGSDAQGGPNHPPFVEDSQPPVGQVFTAGSDQVVAVTLSDNNVDDILSVRFLLDYPGSEGKPGTLVHRLDLPRTSSAVRPPVRVQLRCDSPVRLDPGTHRFVMSVSDRPYLDPANGENVDRDAPFDSVPADAKRIRALWTVHCP